MKLTTPCPPTRPLPPDRFPPPTCQFMRAVILCIVSVSPISKIIKRNVASIGLTHWFICAVNRDGVQGASVAALLRRGLRREERAHRLLAAGGARARPRCCTTASIRGPPLAEHASADGDGD